MNVKYIISSLLGCCLMLAVACSSSKKQEQEDSGLSNFDPDGTWRTIHPEICEAKATYGKGLPDSDKSPKFRCFNMLAEGVMRESDFPPVPLSIRLSYDQKNNLITLKDPKQTRQMSMLSEFKSEYPLTALSRVYGETFQHCVITITTRGRLLFESSTSGYYILTKSWDFDSTFGESQACGYYVNNHPLFNYLTSVNAIDGTRIYSVKNVSINFYHEINKNK